MLDPGLREGRLGQHPQPLGGPDLPHGVGTSLGVSSSQREFAGNAGVSRDLLSASETCEMDEHQLRPTGLL